jgi:hypothetical protein
VNIGKPTKGNLASLQVKEKGDEPKANGEVKPLDHA